jgi:hypothetical protein
MTWLGATGLVGGGHCGAGGDIIVFGGAQTVEDGTKLVLDGGTDNDWQYAASGEEAIIVGGLCRDVVFSKSAGGILWGDVENSFLRKGDGARVYVKDGTEHVIADDKTSAVAGNPVMVTYSDGTVAQARVYENDVKTVMALLQPVIEGYIGTSRAAALTANYARRNADMLHNRRSQRQSETIRQLPGRHGSCAAVRRNTPRTMSSQVKGQNRPKDICYFHASRYAPFYAGNQLIVMNGYPEKGNFKLTGEQVGRELWLR